MSLALKACSAVAKRAAMLGTAYVLEHFAVRPRIHAVRRTAARMVGVVIAVEVEAVALPQNIVPLGTMEKRDAVPTERFAGETVAS